MLSFMRSSKAAQKAKKSAGKLPNSPTGTETGPNHCRVIFAIGRDKDLKYHIDPCVMTTGTTPDTSVSPSEAVQNKTATTYSTGNADGHSPKKTFEKRTKAKGTKRLAAVVKKPLSYPSAPETSPTVDGSHKSDFAKLMGLRPKQGIFRSPLNMKLFEGTKRNEEIEIAQDYVYVQPITAAPAVTGSLGFQPQFPTDALSDLVKRGLHRNKLSHFNRNYPSLPGSSKQDPTRLTTFYQCSPEVAYLSTPGLTERSVSSTNGSAIRLPENSAPECDCRICQRAIRSQPRVFDPLTMTEEDQIQLALQRSMIEYVGGRTELQTLSGDDELHLALARSRRDL